MSEPSRTDREREHTERWVVRDDEGLYYADGDWTDGLYLARRLTLADAEVVRDRHRDRGAVMLDAHV